MSRLSAPSPESTDARARSVLGATERALGFVPNMMRTMASAPAVLSGYANLSGALSGGALAAPLREKIALLAAQENGCDYCLAAHTALAGVEGLSGEAILDARRGVATDGREQAALDFARDVLDRRGRASDEQVARVRAAGHGDREIAEIVANVALSVFTNYFNNVAQTEIDFPSVPTSDALAA